jgi:spore maturation protein CgeB
MDIAVIANCELRNNGTFSYCHRALKQLEEQGKCRVKHFQPRGTIPEFDFYIYIDDGRDELEWLPPHPCAYWAIDTHLGYGYRLWKARHFDRVFVAQKPAVADFKRDGIENVRWLPLACHPEAHPSKEELLARGASAELLEQRWDIAFVGYLADRYEESYNSRVDYLDALFTAFPNSRLATNRFFEEMAIRYIKARLGFNISIKRDLNMRVFEVMSTGCPLLTNMDVDGIGDLFVQGIHYFGYKGKAEMVDTAKEALSMNGERAEIGRNGLRCVRANHTYIHRMERIIEEMKHV